MTEILTDLVNLILDAHLLRDTLTFSAAYLSLTFAEKLKFPQFLFFLQTEKYNYRAASLLSSKRYNITWMLHQLFMMLAGG